MRARAGELALPLPAFLDLTSGMQAALHHSDDHKEAVTAILEKRLGEIPLQRPAAMNEIAQAVCWLLGPASSYLTGAVLPIDGGECAR